jgi:hypothetical protein
MLLFLKSLFWGVIIIAFSSISFAECNFNCSSPKISKTKKHSYMSIRGVAVTTYVPPKKINRDKSLIFWNPRPDQFSCLMSSSTPKINSNFDKTVKGYKYPMRKKGASKFMTDNLNLVNIIIWYGGKKPEDEKSKNRLENAIKTLKLRVLNAAKKNAFTKVSWGKGGSSPAFVTAVNVKSMAFVMSALESMGALSENEFSILDAWVYKMILNMAKTKCSGNCDLSPDSMVSVFSANILYGAATKNRELFELGKKEFENYLSKRNISKVGEGIRNTNEVMHHAIIASDVLAKNDVNAFNWQLKDGTFNDAIIEHARNVISLGSKPIKTSGDKHDKARSIFKKQAFGTHLAWIPIYLSRKKDLENSNVVEELDKKLTSSSLYDKPYFGLQVGVSSGCFYGKTS